MTKALEIRLGRFEFGEAGLVVRGQPTFEEWEACGEVLSRADKMVHWWVGDWVNYGEDRWGERYAQALDASKFAYGTVRNDAWVARRFALSRRRDNLSFGHHQAVASLPELEQEALLSLAEPGEEEAEPRLSREQLRTLVRERRGEGLPVKRLRVWVYEGKVTVIVAAREETQEVAVSEYWQGGMWHEGDGITLRELVERYTR